MKRRDDEFRILKLEVQELERSIAVTVKLVPQIPMLDQDVARLQKVCWATSWAASLWLSNGAEVCCVVRTCAACWYPACFLCSMFHLHGPKSGGSYPCSMP